MYVIICLEAIMLCVVVCWCVYTPCGVSLYPLQSTTRQRRQSTSNATKDLRCEERFVVAPSLSQFILVSACPDGAPPPTLDRLRELCKLLMATVDVSECEYPDGSIERRPTPRPLPPARYCIQTNCSVRMYVVFWSVHVSRL